MSGVLVPFPLWMAGALSVLISLVFDTGELYIVDFQCLEQCLAHSRPLINTVDLLTLGMPAKQVCKVSVFRESLRMEIPALNCTSFNYQPK